MVRVVSRPPCLLEGCNRESRTGGYCHKDYERLRLRGELPVREDRYVRRGVYEPNIDVDSRYESKVDRSAGPTDCHPWLASKNDQGYGYFRHEGRMHLAHRWAFERYVQEIPGLDVRHKCDNPPCQNLDHMESGTHAQNIQDMVQRGRSYDRSGEANPNTGLTIDQVEAIRTSKEPVSVLAERYGLKSEQSVRNIQLGLTWKGKR